MRYMTLLVLLTLGCTAVPRPPVQTPAVDADLAAITAACDHMPAHIRQREHARTHVVCF